MRRAHAVYLGPGLPAVHGERTVADLAGLPEGLLGHADEGILAETRLAEDGKLLVGRVQPIGKVGIAAVRHGLVELRGGTTQINNWT